MSEQADVIEALNHANVTAAMRWAANATYTRVLADFDPDTGHGQGWVGTTAYYLLQDRLDRVFTCGKYVLDDVAVDSGRDLLQAGISQQDFDQMPVIEPGTVVRDDVNGSPGWRLDEWRWLLSSAPFGGSDSIPWPQKSPTKQAVAKQVSPDEPILFSDEELGLPATQVPSVPIVTLVLVHSVDRDSGSRELYIGRSRLNEGGGYGWHWKADLLGETPIGSGRGRDDRPGSPDTSDKPQAPDVDVRLRKRDADRKDGNGGTGTR